MSDYMGDLQKVRQLSQFEMRHSYDSNKTEDKKKMGEFNYYDKEKALEENAVIERVLKLQKSDELEEKLPDLTQQEMGERLFTNKVYLLVNEHSKTDSPYMTAVKDAVTDLTEALYAPMDATKVGESLNRISTLYETAIGKCNDYLTRGSGHKKPPFWPWHKQRFDAVEEMEKNLQDEKAKFEENKKIVFAKLDTEELGMENQKGDLRETQINESSFYSKGELLLKSAMDVVMLDRLDSDKQGDLLNYYRHKEEDLFEPSEEVDDVKLPYQYQNLGTAMEEIKKAGEGSISNEKIDQVIDGYDAATKFVDSDAAEILDAVNKVREHEKGGMENDVIDEDIQILEEVVHPVKKDKKTVDISPEVQHMAGVMLDQLKTIKKDPARLLSHLSNKELSTGFDIHISDNNRSLLEREADIREKIKKSAIRGRVLFDSLMKLNGGSAYETYKKYVVKVNVSECAKEVVKRKGEIEAKALQRNVQKNFVADPSRE